MPLSKKVNNTCSLFCIFISRQTKFHFMTVCSYINIQKWQNETVRKKYSWIPLHILIDSTVDSITLQRSVQPLLSPQRYHKVTNITTTELYFPQEFSSNLICWYGNELPCLSQAGRKVEVVSGGIRSSVYEGVIFWWALLPFPPVREILRETPINLCIDIEITFTSFLLFFVSHFYWNSRVVFRGTHLSWFQLG